MRKLSFGKQSDHPIEGVEWPSFLQKLHLGHGFTKPLAGMMLPASLEVLSNGKEYLR